jgi:hypothetical protein
MSGKKPAEPSAESVARAKRQRLAQEEGVRAMADLERQAIEVRRNMQRLRALREAKEADEIKRRTVLPQSVQKKGKGRIVR